MEVAPPAMTCGPVTFPRRQPKASSHCSFESRRVVLCRSYVAVSLPRCADAAGRVVAMAWCLRPLGKTLPRRRYSNIAFPKTLACGSCVLIVSSFIYHRRRRRVEGAHHDVPPSLVVSPNCPYLVPNIPWRSRKIRVIRWWNRAALTSLS